MIVNTKGKRVKDVLAKKAGKGFPSGILKIARRKLSILDIAKSWTIYVYRLQTGWKHLKVIEKANTQSV